MSIAERFVAALADRYRLERELGQGGMATVYLAEDLKHEREVALKVLRPELAAVIGADRFLAEIKTTANLQHPHILPLFDSGVVDGTVFYAMPFVEGESLRDRLSREKQLPIADAVRITSEVAGALDYAHRKGVIHRDIKPENILLHDGRALVADFGIALAATSADSRMTETGMSLGTPHYMSPEQAMGERNLDARTDVYALGCVLYEMLAGEPPFTGPTAQSIVAKVMTAEPEAVSTYRKTVPSQVEHAVKVALAKLPADRFANAQAFVEALQNPSFGADRSGVATSSGRGATASSRIVSRLGWGVGAIGLALSAWALQTRAPASGESLATQHLNIVLPDSAPLAFTGVDIASFGYRALALTPDGRTLVYTAQEGKSRLYRRALDGFEVTPIQGTEGAYHPTVSPDGEWVAFFVGAELRKVPIGGGVAVPLAAISETYGMDWHADGRLLVTAREGQQLLWIPEAGGTPERVAIPARTNVASPHILPDGRHALITTVSPVGTLVIGAVDLATGRMVGITRDGPTVVDSLDFSQAIPGTSPRFLASGHLLYTTPNGVMATAFDPTTLAPSGTAVEVLRGVRTAGLNTQYAVSVDGTLVYAAGSDSEVGALVWVSRDGSVDSLGFAPERFGTFALSPDGRRVVTLVTTLTSEKELWVYDLDRMTKNKVVTRGSPFLPRWWPDGKALMFTEASIAPPYSQVVVRQLVESTGERDTLVSGWRFNELAPDRQSALGSRTFGSGSWRVPLQAGAEPVAIDSFPSAWGPAISPDGRWIAYTSNEAGQYEVYVTEAGRSGARRKVSLAGGEEPLWSRRGDELIYRWGYDVFAVRVPSAGEQTFGQATRIFRGPFVNPFERSHDIAPDGRRHLLILGPAAQSTDHLNVITHWAELVRQRVQR